MTPCEFDWKQPAENGLSRGLTTGTCATAALKAALNCLVFDEILKEVKITLPDRNHYVTVFIDDVSLEKASQSARATVIKDAGDDPDQTHRARIWVQVSKNQVGTIRFYRGEGVGVVTAKGLQIPIGEPAINPTPRKMMLQAIDEVFDQWDGERKIGFDVQVGCEKGEKIARRTFNPRLGIQGGISILGTTGIVEPKSMASFKASIEIYIRVALAEQPQEIVLTPGNLGQRFARSSLNIPLRQVVQMSNFLGFSLDSLNQTLEQNQQWLPKLWIVGHPGKLAKVLSGIWETHSSRSDSAINIVREYAAQWFFLKNAQPYQSNITSVEEWIEWSSSDPSSFIFWSQLENQIAQTFATRTKRVEQIFVRLFSMNGKALGIEQ